ncbi:hypothetical protein Efla_003696 [Eimeria flavescens]
MERPTFTRKATVEIQRRPARAGTVTLKPNSSMQKTRSFGDPRAIPQLLKQVYAPEEFDESSSMLVCNFPAGLSAPAARNYLAWFGPVVRVERIQSIAGESNFVVVFSNPEPARVLKEASELLFLDNKTPIFCRAVDTRPTLWNKISALWGSPASVRPAEGASV